MSRNSPGPLSATWAIISRDLRLELTSFPSLASMLAFGVAVVLVPRSFASELSPDWRARIFWLGVLFAALFGIFHTFAAEKDLGTWPALLLAPISRELLYLAKFVVILVLLLVLELVMLGAFAVLYLQDPIGGFAGLLVLLLGTVGVAAAGTLVSALTSGRRNRLLLPVLLLPLLLYTVLLPAIRLHSLALRSASLPGQSVAALFLFDLVAVGLGLLLMEWVVELD